MYEKVDSSVDSILNLLFRLRQFKSKINTPEFSHGEMAILHISAFDNKAKSNELSPSYISKVLNVSRPTITSALNSLENKGYIKRENISNDRRKTSISITREGREFLDYNFLLLCNMVSDVITELGEDKTKILIQLVDESINILEKNSEKAAKKILNKNKGVNDVKII